MQRLPIIALAAATGLAALASALPAHAQDAGGDKVVEKFLYGDEPCPQSSGDTIIVCARMPENERYRIPPDLRHSNSPENTSWTAKVKSYETVGKFGPMSCTPIGAGGDLGCTEKMIANAYAEKKHSEGKHMSELVNAARDKRLSNINSEAAATQARVEDLEKAYDDKVAKAEGKPLPSKEEVNPDAKVEMVESAAKPGGRVPPPDFSQDTGDSSPAADAKSAAKTAAGDKATSSTSDTTGSAGSGN